MIDETDISEGKRWLHEKRAKIVVRNLQKRHIDARCIPSREAALSTILGMIPEGVTVARADSVIIDQVGIIPALKKNNRNTVIDPCERGDSGHLVVGEQERLRIQKEAFCADVFLAGTNAVTIDGKLVNTDGLGNRVAPMIFGQNLERI